MDFRIIKHSFSPQRAEVEVPFETFDHLHSLTLLPPPQEKNQIWTLCQFVKKSHSQPPSPPPTPPPPPPPPKIIYLFFFFFFFFRFGSFANLSTKKNHLPLFQIWILCQSVKRFTPPLLPLQKKKYLYVFLFYFVLFFFQMWIL